ncbi:hypothetical protein [Thiomicrorhabdus sp.]|uniref:hypothetical protein n=1 Tax=Thiomicrorhabdus sp. TaxID=2039724 RepID=UPI0035657C42
MIPENSFLRNIPFSLETKTIMELEAIAFSIDAIYLKHYQVSKWAENCDEVYFINAPYQERLELFLNLWSIVDQAYNLRRLFKTIKNHVVIERFLDVTGSVPNMRNGMDHLPENISNKAAKKGSVIPVYGVFSFGKFELEDEGVNVDDCMIYTMTAGSLTHSSHKWPVANLSSGKILDLPVGMFEFTAFDSTLDISALVRHLREIVHLFDTSVRAHVESQIREQSEQKGLDSESLMSKGPGSIATVIKGKFI